MLQKVTFCLSLNYGEVLFQGCPKVIDVTNNSNTTDTISEVLESIRHHEAKQEGKCLTTKEQAQLIFAKKSHLKLQHRDRN